jgi:hypothetical protein
MHAPRRQERLSGEFVIKRIELARVGVLLVCGAMTSAAFASGTGTFIGADRLQVTRCGSDPNPQTVDFTLTPSGGWTAIVGGNTYTGTSTASSSGRNVTLALDGPSFALLTQVLVTQASQLCNEIVSVTTLAVTRATLKLNKANTAAKLRVRAMAAGTAASGTGRGKYDLKVSGPWVAP